MNTTPGLLASARSILAGVIEIGQTRLRLASTEIEEERLRLAELLLWATFALFFLGVGLVFAALLVVLLFWDGPREWVLAAMTTVFLGVGVCASVVWRRKARDKPAFLATTMAELQRDQAALNQSTQ